MLKSKCAETGFEKSFAYTHSGEATLTQLVVGHSYVALKPESFQDAVGRGRFLG